MKEVIRILEQQEQEEKPVEFTRHLNNYHGWLSTHLQPSDYRKVVYLGKCSVDGDMFATYREDESIDIYKGHLNSGKY